ncbi:hypothetical protein SSS_08744 [Sarcoptes scabiei]|uniref:Uncharacterized protein n=1 Tax=Sarcoptes scabiei TaxID=52283 RepID=A0A834RC64_SARSC|nr:hypothetical protein SSS_08744 [Sarcoptes scabiei]
MKTLGYIASIDHSVSELFDISGRVNQSKKSKYHPDSHLCSKVIITIMFLFINQVQCKQIFLDDGHPEIIVIPYKYSYGFPTFCQLNITQQKYELLRLHYQKCQDDNVKQFDLTAQNMLTDSKEFCCFLKSVLECEKVILTQCDPSYNEFNTEETEQLMQGCLLWPVNKCLIEKKLNQKSTPDWVYITSGTVGGAIIVLATAYWLLGSYRRMLWANFAGRGVNLDLVSNILQRRNWTKKILNPKPFSDVPIHSTTPTTSTSIDGELGIRKIRSIDKIPSFRMFEKKSIYFEIPSSGSSSDSVDVLFREKLINSNFKGRNGVAIPVENPDPYNNFIWSDDSSSPSISPASSVGSSLASDDFVPLLPQYPGAKLPRVIGALYHDHYGSPLKGVKYQHLLDPIVKHDLIMPAKEAWLNTQSSPDLLSKLRPQTVDVDVPTTSFHRHLRVLLRFSRMSSVKLQCL